jgi:hypothetical protein
MSYNSTRAKIETLLAILDAANNPNVPNGTTKRINHDLERMVDMALGKIRADAHRPNVPNGTTIKIKTILAGATLRMGRAA